MKNTFIECDADLCGQSINEQGNCSFQKDIIKATGVEVNQVNDLLLFSEDVIFALENSNVVFDYSAALYNEEKVNSNLAVDYSAALCPEEIGQLIADLITRASSIESDSPGSHPLKSLNLSLYNGRILTGRNTGSIYSLLTRLLNTKSELFPISKNNVDLSNTSIQKLVMDLEDLNYHVDYSVPLIAEEIEQLMAELINRAVSIESGSSVTYLKDLGLS
ncbi:MAG: hypothetical protein EOP34_11530 [Rickettsiales bacterium]|nr:MAG: hypothetical protein EOP34_11530 [Rickettsiales bacterium]